MGVNIGVFAHFSMTPTLGLIEIRAPALRSSVSTSTSSKSREAAVCTRRSRNAKWEGWPLTKDLRDYAACLLVSSAIPAGHGMSSMTDRHRPPVVNSGGRFAAIDSDECRPAHVGTKPHRQAHAWRWRSTRPVHSCYRPRPFGFAFFAPGPSCAITASGPWRSM